MAAKRAAAAEKEALKALALLKAAFGDKLPKFAEVMKRTDAEALKRLLLALPPTGASPQATSTETAHELEVLLADFAKNRLSEATKVTGGKTLSFVQAGSQATLLAGDVPIGMITILLNDVVFKPALNGRSGTGREVMSDDLWNWVIAATSDNR